MKPAPFTYRKPATVDEALAMMSGNAGERSWLAGGQSLVPMLNFRLAAPEVLIDINGLKELDYVRLEGGRLLIGALTRHSTLARSPVVRDACPLLHHAYRHVAHETIRNRGTLGGNLSHADPASEMPAAMLALEATMTLRSATRQRVVPAADFFLGLFATAAEPDEMLTEIALPIAPPGQRAAFQEVSRRKGDFALVGVAIAVVVADGRCRDARIACCGVAERALRLTKAEARLNGQAATLETAQACARTAEESVDPQSDAKASAEYRRQLIGALVGRMLADLFNDKAAAVRSRT